MQITRIAEVTRIFVEEGLGYLTERRGRKSSDETGKAATADAGVEPVCEDGADEARDGEVASPSDDDGSPTEATEASTALARQDTSDVDLARRLRRTLERLGPTFVKFGQMLGTRVDLFSAEFIEELGKLHSQVAPFPTPEARAIVEAELGRPIDEVFEDFPDEPVAAASIAQVYKARLRDRDEHEHGWVAIKVQRPGLDKSLLRDLDALIEISWFFDKLIPTYHRSMAHTVAEEYARRARGELEFRNEARAIDRFAEVLRSLPKFRAPRVHHHLCTNRLLVMEWLDGTKLDEVSTPAELEALGFDRTVFARSMLELQLSMSYEHGFVHGDTHPGNIILLPTGHVALIDFGLHGHVPRALRDKMLEMLFYQSTGRNEAAVEAFIAVFKPDPRSDLDAFRSEMKALLDAGADQRALEESTITDGLIDGMRIGSKYRMEAQSDLLMVIRNLAIIEGIVLRFCPDLDVNTELEQIIQDIMRRKVFGPSMRDEMTQLLPQLLLNISQRPLLAERMLQLERSFVASKNLGEFFRKEGVMEVRSPDRPWPLVAATVIGVVIGFLLAGLF